MSGSFSTIVSKREFNRVYSGKKVVSTAMVLFSAVPLDQPLVAFVASKKIGGAVLRNRAKRLMRAALRSIYGPGDLDMSLILLARHSIINKPFLNIVSDLRYCLKKARSK